MPRQTVKCPNEGRCGRDSHEVDGSGRLERCRAAAASRAVQERSAHQRSNLLASQRAAVGLPPAAVEPTSTQDRGLMQDISVEHDVDDNGGPVVVLEGDEEAVRIGMDGDAMGYASVIAPDDQRAISAEREVFQDSNGDPWVRLGTATDAPLYAYLSAASDPDARLPLGTSAEQGQQAREELQMLARYAYSPEGADFIADLARTREPMLGTHPEHFQVVSVPHAYSDRAPGTFQRGSVTHWDAIDVRTGKTVMFAFGSRGELELAIERRVQHENDHSMENLMDDLMAQEKAQRALYRQTIRDLVSGLGQAPLSKGQVVAVRAGDGIEMARIDSVGPDGSVTAVVTSEANDRPLRLSKAEADGLVVRSLADLPAEYQS